MPPLSKNLVPSWVNQRLMISCSLPWVGISLAASCVGCPSYYGKQVVRLWQTQPQLGFCTFFRLGPSRGREATFIYSSCLLLSLARYFLVQRSYCVDLWMCMVVYELKKGNPTGLIWAKPLMVWMPFIARKKLLYGKSSSSSGTIPNFCLSSQPSGIPLILHGLPFGFQPIEALYIIFHYYFHFCFLDMAAREASVASTSNHTPQHFGLLTSSK